MNESILNSLHQSLERFKAQPDTDYVALEARVHCGDEVWLDVSSLGDLRLHYGYGGTQSLEATEGWVCSFRMGLNLRPFSLALLLEGPCWSTLLELIAEFGVAFVDGDHVGCLSPAGNLASVRLTALFAVAQLEGCSHLTTGEADRWREGVPLQGAPLVGTSRGLMRNPARVLH